MEVEAYRKYIEEKGLTKYQVSKDTGISRATLSQVFNGKQDITVTFMMKFGMAYGFYPEGVKLPEVGSASPKVIKEREPAVIDIAACMETLESGVASRIKKAYENKPLPQNTEELVNLMVGSWRTGVLDAGKFFASANADKKDI